LESKKSGLLLKKDRNLTVEQIYLVRIPFPVQITETREEIVEDCSFQPGSTPWVTDTLITGKWILTCRILTNKDIPVLPDKTWKVAIQVFGQVKNLAPSATSTLIQCEDSPQFMGYSTAYVCR